MGGFKCGHSYCGSRNATTSGTRQTNSSMWLRRLNMDEYSRVVHITPDGLLTVPDAAGICGTGKILRPQPSQCPDLTDSYLQTEEIDGVSEIRLLNMQKNVAMWNECFTEHAKNTTCTSPQLEVHNERQVGLCWKMSLHCLHCEYQSGMYKLYTEVDIGSCDQKPATSNVALHVGLQDSTIGITKMRHILAATNTSPPSRCGLQRNADRVATITAQATMDDLKKKREQSKEINILRGLPENSPINISMDVRYNTTAHKNSYGVGQAASQAIGAAIEWQTDQYQIVGFHLENKLCKVGAMLRSQGQNVTCPGHEQCSATLRAVDPILEYEIGKQIGYSFAHDNAAIRYVATDGDALASHGVQDAMPAAPTERQADTTHLGQTQFRHIMKASFSPRMTRCQKIYTSVHTLYSSDINTITSKMPKIIQTTVDGYAGSCKNCRRHAVVCRGGLQNNWWHKSQHLKASGMTRLNMTYGDRLTLQGLIEMRLRNAALQMTQ